MPAVLHFKVNEWLMVYFDNQGSRNTLPVLPEEANQHRLRLLIKSYGVRLICQRAITDRFHKQSWSFVRNLLWWKTSKDSYTTPVGYLETSLLDGSCSCLLFPFDTLSAKLFSACFDQI
ncbi:hypothetical protein R1flu_022876 [Riccia fluitans]|uniref:Maturase K n=1 Tax=Riccia fluitans TaxID=41844 RepID=A0ABD1XQF3_9MARC